MTTSSSRSSRGCSWRGSTRCSGAAGPAWRIASRTLRFGRLAINLTSRTVNLNGEPIELSRNEFELLAHLAAHAGKIQSRNDLFRSLYNREYDGIDRMLDIRVSRLRRKLGEDAEHSERIKTIWGAGYLFVPDAW